MAPFARKSTRQSWAEIDMKNAIEAVMEKKMGQLLASKTFGVPFTTLRRRASSGVGCKKGYLGGRKPTFDQVLEKEILHHLKELEIRLFAMTPKDVCKLAQDIAETNGIPHYFSKTKKAAGWDWLKGFRMRNPTISLRTPEATSAARARAFNKPQVANYFNNLKKTLEEVGFEPQNIWKVEEWPPS